MLPIIADGEAGFGGPLNVFELAKNTRERIHETALHMDIDVPLYDTDSVIRHLENYISKKEQEERFREWEKMQAEISSVDGLIHESSRMFSNS